jgi:hypothetical protein
MPDTDPGVSPQVRPALPGEALTRRAVTVITAAIMVMAFAFSLGNVTRLLVTWNHCGVPLRDARRGAIASPQAEGDGGRAGDGRGAGGQVAGPGAARAGC